MSVGSVLKKGYEGLGNNKSQRFWRLFLILCLLSAVSVAGFKYDAIKINLGFKTEGSK